MIHLADAVHAVALTPDDEVLLVRQFRAGSGRDSLEIPGGLVDPGEDPCAAGARELLEETGYAGDPPEFLGTLWSNPSLMTSRISTIVIRNARPVAEPDLDDNEELTIERVHRSEIPRLIREGRIDHALVVAGLLWWLALDGARADDADRDVDSRRRGLRPAVRTGAPGPVRRTSVAHGVDHARSCHAQVGGPSTAWMP